MHRPTLTALAGSVLALCSSLALAGGLLVVAPHPDDDLLMAAGVIANAKARGDQVKVVFMTNGDFTGQSMGNIRQSEAVDAQTLHLGTNENDLIFLGYPDGGLPNLYDDYPAVTDAYTGPNGRSTTYASRGLGMTDYHDHQFGAHALYNRANLVADLQSIISSYRPDHIITTAEYDKHLDHATTFRAVKAALDAAIAALPGYNPALHKTIVWADYIYDNPVWPSLIDPTSYHIAPDNLDDMLPWNDRESIEVPIAMQSTNLLLNPKYQSIDSHVSQGGGDSFLGRFVHKDEIFWAEGLSGATLPPRAVASGPEIAASGETVQLSSTGSNNPGGGALTYSWRQVDGPLVILLGASTATPTFQAPIGLFQDTLVNFELVVSHGSNHSLPDLVGIAVLGSTDNIAPQATATASSENTADGQLAQRAIDGVIDGYPGDSSREWTTLGEGAGAWLQLQWPAPVTITRVALFDRPNADDFITGGVLTFSDGSSLTVPALLNSGGGRQVSMTPRTVTWVKFTVDSVAPTTQNIGLAEMQVFGFNINQPPVANAGVARTVVAGTTVQLDGSASTDLEHDALTYQWLQTSGPSVTLTNASTEQPSFTAPAGPATLSFGLKVNDGQHDSATATVVITVLSAADLDHNGLADSWETLYGVSDPNADPDGDGLTNLQEYTLGTHPTDAAPTVNITAPIAGGTYAAGVPIHLAGTASDAEDGNLSASIQWRSNSAGLLGTGPSLNKLLGVGTHTITATVVDSTGAAPKTIPARQIQVSVVVRNGDINGDGKVDVADVLQLQQYLNGSRSLDSAAIARGDLYPVVAGDNQLTLSDLLLLEKQLTTDN